MTTTDPPSALHLSPPLVGADVDHWVWQLWILDDLTLFVREHGPQAALPLPVLNWTLGAFGAIGADLPGHAPDPTATLAAYALALGTQVTERTASDRTVYSVRGRIGRREGTGREPRTSVTIRATVWREDGDRA